MAIITGRIKSIKEETTKAYIKKKVKLKVEKEDDAFIEFRGVSRFLLKNFKVNDIVIISYRHSGKMSKSGHEFNNLVGTSIERI